VKPLLVGELNPYGSDPRYALYPMPERSAGGRLCKILGLTMREYLSRFDRTNLCTGEWKLQAAREAAWNLSVAVKESRPIILLGVKVCTAFTLEYAPFTKVTDNDEFYILPHPSGKCRTWNNPSSVGRARELLAEFLK